MRIKLLWLIVAFLCFYAYRDWFKALCGLILLMAVIEHPDIPKTVGGIQGLNPWNLVFLCTFTAWLMGRRAQGLVWDMPKHVTWMLLAYLGVVVAGFIRMIADSDNIYLGLHQETIASLISEYFVNTIKWVVPGLMLYDGCRTRKRMTWGLAAVLGIYVLLALQLVRWMPPGTALSGTELTLRSRKIIENEIGFHAVNMSMILSGASWAMLAMMPLARKRWHKIGIGFLFVLIAYGQAVTAGRMGYVTWAMIGLILCVIRWRKMLLLVPVVPVLVTIFLPGVAERFTEGMGSNSRMVGEAVDDYAVTSGRTLIWPYVIDKIEESPIVGYGRQAMVRTGVSTFLLEELGEGFPHPHNAYLEMLFDNGVIGFILVMPFYVMIVWYSVLLFRDKRNPMFAAVGGMSCSLVLALLIAAMGSQTFYPREGAVGMWCAIGMMLRMYKARQAMPALARQAQMARVREARMRHQAMMSPELGRAGQ
ncbi:MAG TPA: O-antigen ligase family protein [Phycisphaerae bacterium]|nr:O-antigen ligase family protein [Phycisphaerales bacterium]HNO76801.1 O-antigen ligase family protein [Phycisphaerae bacterium]